KRYLSRHAILLSILTGVIYSIGGGLILTSELELVATIPVLTPPAYNLSTLIGVGFPLFLVTMTSQNVPGNAVLRAHGYKTPASPLIAWSGLTGLLLAPFGGFAFNLAAITASICMGKEVDNDSPQRYLAAIWAGIFYLVMGVFGATVVQIIAVFPQELVMSIAGLALLTITGNSLKLALRSDQEQEAALLTFAITASGITLFSIGAPFWGLVIGLVLHRFRDPQVYS
ncbi:MAG: benzoate/H(+) symporter BenE family transporter, partial [Pseudomonadales bacterium]|nr:benzoate/H(+) symporter BenE family transporter [Pseudomonadales bacterium]